MAPGEVELKEKAGTAWSHSYLNQKPWHPLSYPNQRRKWIAEQMHANHARRQEEVQREFAQEQEFFRQTALFSKKDKEKMEVMKAVSFMYVRPPGYNAESAKAAEIEDEKKRSGPGDVTQGAAAASTSSMPNKGLEKSQPVADKKNRPKDVFGRPLPTEQEFEVLKNAPRLDTGAPVRIKPFGVEVRNVRCLRCGNYGHQSGDRECPLKDVIMPNEENRLKRDDPLTTIKAQTDSVEPLKWELKQMPGMSPPRGGFDPDDPNQQIVAEEIFDEYGGFLGNCDIPALLSNFSAKKSKKRSKSKSKHKKVETESRRHLSSPLAPSDSEDEDSNRKPKSKREKKYSSDSSDSEDDDSNRKYKGKRKGKYSSDSSYSDYEVEAHKDKHKSRRKHMKKYRSESSSDSEVEVNKGSGRHLKREHKKKIGESEAAHYSFSKDKRGAENKRHSGRSRERRHYSESSSSESERHLPLENRYNSDSSSSDTNRYSRRLMDRQRHTDLSARRSDRYSKSLDDKQRYNEPSCYQSSRHSRKSRDKRHRHSSPSDHSGSDCDRHNYHRHYRR